MPSWGELPQGVRNEIVELFCSQGISESELVTRYDITNPGNAARRLREQRQKRMGSRAGTQNEEPAEFLGVAIKNHLRRQPMSLLDLCDAVHQTPATVRAAIAQLQAGGVPVCIQDERASLPDTPPPAGSVSTIWQQRAGRVATLHVSDTHFGSEAVQKTALDLITKIAVEEYGVKAAFHSGDVMAGNQVYAGQEFEVYAAGWQAQHDDTIHSLPQHAGLTWYLLGGNHDASYYKQARVDVIELLAKDRPDVVPCGWDAADVPLTENCDIRMWHPSGGQPYAISYRGQKHAAQIAQAELLALIMEWSTPRIRLLQIGHLHVMMGPTLFGGLRFFQAGCFEGMNAYLKRKGLTPQIGGYIMEHEVTEGGQIRSVTFRDFVSEQIEDDWKCHRRPDPKLSRGVDVVCRFSEMDAAPEYYGAH